MIKTLGGDRLGSGKKMRVELENYQRSTHNLSYVWRSSMSAGTLVPFMSRVALPGDTWDINLECDVMTHPTVGPLLGSYKVQLDLFMTPMRLYNSLLHNNALKIGLNMAQALFPIFTLTAPPFKNEGDETATSQISPSSLLAYLGIRGIGRNETLVNQTRDFNAIPLLVYWDIYKNYYAFKQSEVGAVLYTDMDLGQHTIDTFHIMQSGITNNILEYPSTSLTVLDRGALIQIAYTGVAPRPDRIMVILQHPDFTTYEIPLNEFVNGSFNGELNPMTATWRGYPEGAQVIAWRYFTQADMSDGTPQVQIFELETLDQQREDILTWNNKLVPYTLNTQGYVPYQYSFAFDAVTGKNYSISNQQGLAIKTYQSDLYNNWLATDWIDGVGGINDITKMSTIDGAITQDTLILSQKLYKYLNRVAVSDGTYNSWVEVTYDHEGYKQAYTPMYMGGLVKQLVFQEIISNTATADQPLGSLAGKGTMSSKHKGGSAIIRVDEPSYITGIVSITPYIDYSQGNDWDMHLKSWDDLHKPALDQIGFQPLITEQLAWWGTKYNAGSGLWEQKSAGKQPAWLNYMTDVNRTYGNFAEPANEMFMTLNRRYEVDEETNDIADLLPYIDPAKYNFVFAETSRDSQNFWVQIGNNIECRRKMSAKLMPNM